MCEKQLIIIAESASHEELIRLMIRFLARPNREIVYATNYTQLRVQMTFRWDLLITSSVGLGRGMIQLAERLHQEGKKVIVTSVLPHETEVPRCVKGTDGFTTKLQKMVDEMLAKTN